MNLITKAAIYANTCHANTNHLYDGMPYDHHLNMVAGVAQTFIHLVPDQDREVVIASCWVHDTIEDTRQTYNDVKEATNARIADIAYALTNEKGKNRKERANDKYYKGILTTPFAPFVKLCDRIANVQYSLATGSRMFQAYKEENESFIYWFKDIENCKPLIDHLNNLFDL